MTLDPNGIDILAAKVNLQPQDCMTKKLIKLYNSDEPPIETFATNK